VRFRRFVPTFGKAALPWLLEGLLIVFSVVLGFWVSQLQSARADRELATRVLTSVQDEIAYNVTLLDPYVGLHGTWTDRLKQEAAETGTQAAFDIFMRTRPPLPAGSTPFPVLRRSAWDGALAGGAIRLLDHDVAAALSEVYRRQQIVDDNIQRLARGAFGAATTFDPANRTPSLRLLWLTMLDIQTAEASLAASYRRHAPAVRAAIDRAR
jgi:hypothetical protein